jgi:cytochrome c biogenesis protein CcdA
MNKEQRTILTQREEKLKQQLKHRKQEEWLGIVMAAIFISIFILSQSGALLVIFGLGSLIIITVASFLIFVAGIIITWWGFTQKNKIEKEISEINFKLAAKTNES